MNDSATWIRGPELRKRWGGMPNSTFYDRLKRGLIPPPLYPFGGTTPYWAVSAIEAAEAQAGKQSDQAAAPASAPPPEVAPKRPRGRPRKAVPVESQA